MATAIQPGNAASRTARADSSETTKLFWLKSSAWIPLAVMPLAAFSLLSQHSAWFQMWGMAVAIYGGLKWLSFAWCAYENQPSAGRTAGYLLLWPGMDARAFFRTPRIIESPSTSEWVAATFKVVCGIVLLFVAVTLGHLTPLASAWAGMTGLVLILHFGLFHLLSLCWRNLGVDAPPIMNAPLAASSLSDFWGRRWNLAFRDLSHTFLFRPVVSRLGGAGATVFVFLISGIVHDVVISIPAGAGYGLPTLYFLIQACGLLMERSRQGIQRGLKHGLTGRLFCLLVTVAPLGLLFHRPFIDRVVLPMLSAWNLF